MRWFEKPIYAEVQVDTSLERELVWEIISSTNTLNRELGLPWVQYELPQQKENGAITREAQARFGFIKLKWVEYPFEWIRPYYHNVVREFHNGPIKKFLGGVIIEDKKISEQGAPLNDANLTCKVFAYLMPSHIIFRPLVWIIAKASTRKAARYFNGQFNRQKSAFKFGNQSKKMTPVNHARLVELSEKLSATKKFNPELIKLLEIQLRQAPDDHTLGMRPLWFAEFWNQPKSEVISLFLQATKVGILDLEWTLICPNCRVPKSTFKELGAVTDHYQCDFCEITLESTLDRATEIQFSVSQSVRPVEKKLFCIGNPAQFRHILAQLSLAPGQEKKFVLPATQLGGLQLRIARQNKKFHITGVSENTGNEIEIVVGDDLFEIQKNEFQKGKPLTLQFRNHSHKAVLAFVESTSTQDYSLNALSALILPEFRRDFVAQRIEQDQNLAIRSLTFLFTDLKNSTALYERIGDGPAFSIVNKHFVFLREIIEKHEGVIVKTIGDAVMAVYSTCALAIASSIEIQQKVKGFNENNTGNELIKIKVGIHSGPAIAVNANSINDFFGRSVNLAVRIQEKSEGNDVVIGRDNFTTEIRNEIYRRNLQINEFRANLKGVGDFDLIRIEI